MPEPAEALEGTILVVSDDPDIADEARFGLPGNLEAVITDEARSAWAELGSLTPIAVVVDLMTGSAGGYALARDMSEVDRLATVPIVMLIDRDQDAWLARQAGATSTLRKPLEPGALARAVSSVLS